MRLFVIDPLQNEKIYLSTKAFTRRELETKIGGWFFTLENKGGKFSITNVKAELDTDHATIGAFVGAVLGLVIPPLGIGVLIGIFLGSILGQFQDETEKQQCLTFNQS